MAAIIGGAIVAFAGRSFRRLLIAERSMEPALSDGDFVIARRIRAVGRGDVVTTPNPLAEDMLLVKRVVGLPGETIAIGNGQVHVDGEVLAERWADGPTHPDGEWLLGAAEVFLLSDNRAATIADSRGFGPVPVAALEHKLAWRYWPPASAGKIV